MFDNIVAISSAKINQPISIIRVCGPESFDIVKKIFTGKVGKNKQITYGKIYEKNQILDEVLVAWFEGKDNFIGENLVEINCHGNVILVEMILQLIISKGARIAEKGEFTRRAFLNGKMDLVKAEAIHDLIFAKTQKQVINSVKKFDLKTSNLIQNSLNDLTEIIGICEVNIDYPEYEDIEKVDNNFLLEKIEKLIHLQKKILINSENSKKIFQGISVSIVGLPNSGKSSLLNALIGEKKAIVTEIKGTTRDVVEGSFSIENFNFNVWDTAGIRNTQNKVEKIGIKKSFEAIQKSVVTIHLLDGTKKINKKDLEIKNFCQKSKKIYLQVFNKKDLVEKRKIADKKIWISAKSRELENLKNELLKIAKNFIFEDDYALGSSRQISLIKKALKNLLDAKKALKNFLTFDVVIVDLIKAWENLGDILGKKNKENLLDSIFKNFCLGK